MEHPLVDVVGEHEDGVNFVGRAARHSYVGERNSSEADRAKSVPKHRQGIGRWGIHRDGVCFYGAKPETQNIRTTQSQGRDPIPLKYNM